MKEPFKLLMIIKIAPTYNFSWMRTNKPTAL